MSFFKKLFNPSAQNKVMDWREFTEYFIREVEAKTGSTSETEWGADLEETTVRLNLPNGFSAEIYLGNRYAQYRQNPEGLDEIIDETVQTVAQIGNPAALARENIFPTIKPAAYIEEIRRYHQQEGREEQMADFCYRPLSGDLVVMYVADTGPSYRSLFRSDWADVGIADEAQLHALALDNLQHLIRQEESLGYRRSDKGLYQIYFNDVLDASLILLLEDIIGWAGLDLAPHPVFAVPSRNLLLVCAADNQAALQEMQEIVDKEMSDSPYTISPLPYILKNGQINLFNTH